MIRPTRSPFFLVAFSPAFWNSRKIFLISLWSSFSSTIASVDMRSPWSFMDSSDWIPERAEVLTRLWAGPRDGRTGRLPGRRSGGLGGLSEDDVRSVVGGVPPRCLLGVEPGRWGPEGDAVLDVDLPPVLLEVAVVEAA